MKLIFNNSEYMIFEVLFGYNNKFANNKIELQIYDKYFCTETILIGEKAINCKSVVKNFKKYNDEAQEYLEAITTYSRKFDIH